MRKFSTSVVCHFYIHGLTSWIWTNPSTKGLKFESPSKWNAYEGFNLEHWHHELYIFFAIANRNFDICEDLWVITQGRNRQEEILIAEIGMRNDAKTVATGPRRPYTTGWWWRDIQISMKRLAIRIMSVKTPLDLA